MINVSPRIDVIIPSDSTRKHARIEGREDKKIYGGAYHWLAIDLHLVRG